MIKLDIGGGVHKRGEDFISVDIQGGDVLAAMWALPFEDDSIDEIWCSHTLEHCPMGQVPVALAEWLRVLKPNARATIQVPNFDYIAKYWLAAASKDWAERMVFGHQANDGEFHKCAFTAALLTADLEAAGFLVLRVGVIWSHEQETLQAVCMKPDGETRAGYEWHLGGQLTGKGHH